MPRLVQPHDTGTGDSKLDQPPETLVLDRAGELDAGCLQLAHRPVDVVAHEIELVVTARCPWL